MVIQISDSGAASGWPPKQVDRRARGRVSKGTGPDLCPGSKCQTLTVSLQHKVLVKPRIVLQENIISKIFSQHRTLYRDVLSEISFDPLFELLKWRSEAFHNVQVSFVLQSSQNGYINDNR